MTKSDFNASIHFVFGSQCIQVWNVCIFGNEENQANKKGDVLRCCKVPQQTHMQQFRRKDKLNEIWDIH